MGLHLLNRWTVVSQGFPRSFFILLCGSNKTLLPSPALDVTLGPTSSSRSRTELSLPITAQGRKHFLEGGVRLPGQGTSLCFASEEDGKTEWRGPTAASPLGHQSNLAKGSGSCCQNQRLQTGCFYGARELTGHHLFMMVL